MKIAIVSGDDVVGDDPGRLCAALAAQGQEVTAYLRQRGRCSRKVGAVRPGTSRRYRAIGIAVGPATACKDAEVLPFVGDWAATLERLWSSDRPDVVHAYGWLGGLAAQLAVRRHNLPIVQTFQPLAAAPRARSDRGRRRLTERERIEPLLARNATWVTVENSTDVYALARLRHGRARMSILASGVDIDQYTPVGPVADRTDLHRVLSIAPNPLPGNGFDLAISAMPKVPGAELVIAETEVTNRSHDRARNALKRLAAELGVADRVRFVGTIDGDELSKMVRSADVVACTPRQPPRAASVLAAMASGVAVVALPVGVLIDVVVDSVTGLLLSSENSSELAAALRSLLAQEFRCKSMGAAGRNRALSRFTWDRVALDALNIYGQLIGQDSPVRSLRPTGAH
ncbi:glycosyltransferase [Mycobacterium heidelbergense]|uniref:glycosyltransferase n=1 Tax=Mycobacterium heidelbergense TaxID=53376 RepID=UPI003CF0FE2B